MAFVKLSLRLNWYIVAFTSCISSYPISSPFVEMFVPAVVSKEDGRTNVKQQNVQGIGLGRKETLAEWERENEMTLPCKHMKREIQNIQSTSPLLLNVYWYSENRTKKEAEETEGKNK